jgi:hypothetical protein
MVALVVLTGTSQEKVLSEYEVKAAYMVNFARFTEWPREAFAGEASAVLIGVVGRDPFGEALDKTLAGQKVGARPFEIRRGKRLADVGECHLLFISDADRERVEDALIALRGRHVVTVSDYLEFAAMGGVIGFYAEGKKIRFEVNPRAAERQGVKLSSKLLRLARIVKVE